MIVVVTGARGLLGSEIVRSFGERDTVIGWSSAAHAGYRQVDVTRPDEIAAALDSVSLGAAGLDSVNLDAAGPDGGRPDVVINCAANPNIASCQADPEAAREINALAVQKLAAATQERDIALVQISTDYVFSGDQEDGYAENDEPNPLQVYGRTKAEGEGYCREVPRGLVVRLPLLFGVGHAIPKTTFPEDVIRSLRAGKEVPADDGEIRQPTLTTDVAQALHALIQRNATGVFHVAAQQGITKYDWANEIAAQADLDPTLIRPTEPSGDGTRPERSWLLDRRLRALGISAPRLVGASTEAFLTGTGLI
jgi:dTDP-4-dehydrorhamnose reductase